jgi:hypothetical protein
VLNLPSLAAEPQALGEPVLYEGTWTHHGPRSVVGSGTDATVILKKVSDGWTITFERTRYPSVNERGARPKTDREGPFKVTVVEQEMVIARGARESRYTFLCDPGRLIMPAIVQKRRGEWTFRSEDESFSVRCEEDPYKVPVGKAQIPGVMLGKGFYSFEEAPWSRLGPRAQYLRFLERSDEKGQLCERFRLIFDEFGSPRYEQLLGTGERSTNDYQLRVFLASEARK